ncbi:MAG: gamma-glutamyl-gamma-aminobutyrate hydrolase family protein, partial [Alphaproteobacteria bacterium]
MRRERPDIWMTDGAGGTPVDWWLIALLLRAAGARGRRILPGRARPSRSFDGLLLGGGDDIDVRLYAGHLAPTTRSDPERDALELELFAEADRTHRPVLGVCRGAQMINVARGGTLHPDIGQAVPGARARRMPLPVKSVTIAPDSLLADILASRHLRVNAIHHQAIATLGTGLRAVAWDEQGVIQAVEDARGGHFILGVQWHPEYLFWQA